jgi:transcriptional regulator with XRE-family HTH domain
MSIHKAIKARREAIGMTKTELAKRLGVSRAAIDQWERETVAKGGARPTSPKLKRLEAVARALGTSVADLVNSSAPLRNIRPLSAESFTIPPKLSWGEVMGGNLPETFTIEMPDGALHATTPVGTPLLCSTIVKPTIGKGVIVRSADGNAHVRRFSQGPTGGWQAAADAPGYATLHSGIGAKIIATVIGRLDGSV